jgi:hypothetical protein
VADPDAVMDVLAESVVNAPVLAVPAPMAHEFSPEAKNVPTFDAATETPTPGLAQ